jgi:hypothetical protein
MTANQSAGLRSIASSRAAPCRARSPSMMELPRISSIAACCGS